MCSGTNMEAGVGSRVSQGGCGNGITRAVRPVGRVTPTGLTECWRALG